MSKPKIEPKTVKGGKTKEDFRASFDKNFIIPRKLQEAINKLGADQWEFEMEFARAAGVSQTDLGRFRDQFEEYLVVTTGKNPKRVWCGSRELAAELREML